MTTEELEKIKRENEERIRKIDFISNVIDEAPNFLAKDNAPEVIDRLVEEVERLWSMINRMVENSYILPREMLKGRESG